MSDRWWAVLKNCQLGQGGKTQKRPFSYLIFHAELVILHQTWKGYVCVNIGQNVVQKIVHLYETYSGIFEKTMFFCWSKSHLSQSTRPFCSRFAFTKFWSHLTICSLALKGLVYNLLSLNIYWRPYYRRPYFVFPPCHQLGDTAMMRYPTGLHESPVCDKLNFLMASNFSYPIPFMKQGEPLYKFLFSAAWQISTKSRARLIQLLWFPACKSRQAMCQLYRDFRIKTWTILQLPCKWNLRVAFPNGKSSFFPSLKCDKSGW